MPRRRSLVLVLVLVVALFVAPGLTRAHDNPLPGRTNRVDIAPAALIAGPCGESPETTATAKATMVPGQPATPPAPVTGTPAPPETEEPRIILQADATELAVGDFVQISGQASGLGLPIFGVSMRDAGTEHFTDVVRIDYEGQVDRREGGSHVLALVDACGEASGFESRVEMTFQAIASGEVEVMVDASGEVMDASGAFLWGGAAADPLLITVAEAGAATPSATGGM